MIFGIWCTVSGGVTGLREAWLKDDGAIVLFTDQEEAQRRADELTRERSSHSRATFTFTVQPRD